MRQSLLIWILALGLGGPLCVLILNEVIERLDPHHPHLARGFRQILWYVLPPLAMLLVMQQLLNVPVTNQSSRFIETITIIACILAGVTLVNAVFTPADKPGRLQIKVPNLFFQVVRALIVLGLSYRILGGVWQIDLSGLAAAAGVGSLVIALALQETLSNLVSGFLMLLSKPFKEGDYIEFDGVQGFVIDQNWRSVTLRERGNEKNITIPNGVLAKATIDNFGNAEQVGMWHSINCSFSYDDPPFRVLSLLSTLGTGLEQQLTHETVYPVISSYGDFGINYTIWYKKCPGHNKKHPDSRTGSITTALYSRLYYLAKREGLTMPYPIAVEYTVDTQNGIPETIPHRVKDNSSEIRTYLLSLSHFSMLSSFEIDNLVQAATLKNYGLGEIIVQEGLQDDGLYIIYSGSVWSSTHDEQGELYDLGQLSTLDLFGEMALFPGEVSPITIVAREDVQVIVLPVEILRQLIQGDLKGAGNSKFATEILLYIENQRKNLRWLQTKQNREQDSVSY